MIITQLKNRLRQERYIKSRIIHRSDDGGESKGKIKVSIVTGQLATGGVERVLLSIVKGLPKTKFEITIYITDFSNNTWIDKFESYSTIIHVTKQLDWSTDQTLITNYVASSIVSRGDEVVFITNSEIGYQSLPRIHQSLTLRGRRVRVYDLLHTHGTPAENDAFLRISQPYDRYISKRIVISKYLRDYFCEHYPVDKNKILVIHNGIPANQSQIDASKQKGQEFLGLNQSERAITYVGRLQSDKSPERLVELAHITKDKLEQHNAFIAVIGDGNMRSDLEILSKKYQIHGSAIRFYGFSDDPEAIMKASYFTILTSNLEGVPMSILESMNQGTPVIAPSVGGITEIMPGSAGILVDFINCTNEDQKMINLKHGLESALTLDAHALVDMQQKAKKTIDRNFKHMEEDYIQLFEHGRLKLT